MQNTETATRAFAKKCTFCGQIWLSREHFLKDPAVELVGYQANFADLSLGLLLFNHNNCHSTLAANANVFTDLYDGPVFSERRTGKEDCLGNCLYKDDLGLCNARCECAYVREICQIVRQWPKEKPDQPKD